MSTSVQNFRGIKRGHSKLQKFSFWGTDPPNRKQKSGNFGAICSACRGLSGDIKMPGKFRKIREISRVKEKPLAPPSGETGSRRPETGPKCSSGSRGL